MANMGFVGDMNGSAARELAGKITLRPYSGSLPGLDGAIADSATARPSETGQAALASVLHSGRTLALVSPTAQHLASLRAITGSRPSQPVPLVAFTPTKDRGPSRYRCLMLPHGTITSQCFAADSGPGELNERPAPRELAPSIVQAVEASEPPMSLPGDPLPGFVPPLETIWGHSTFTMPISWRVAGTELQRQL